MATAPQRTVIAGRPSWLFSDGTVLPVVAGGDGEEGGTQQGAESTDGHKAEAEGAGQQATGEFPPEVQAILDKANAEAAKHRKELATTRKKLEGFEQAQLSETEKLQKRIQELEGTLQTKDRELLTIKTQAAVSTVAAKLNFVNPTLAHRLIDPSSVTYDDDGKPTNVEALLKEIAKSDPYLVGRRAVDAGQGAGTGTGGLTMNDRLRQAAGRA